MAKRKRDAEDALLEVATRLMLAEGYAGVSIERICRATRLSKGAFFHYFGSKDELAQAVLERFCRRGAEAYREAPFLAEADPLERLVGYIDFTAGLCRDPIRDGCLIGMFSEELSGSNPPLRRQCAAAFAQWAAGIEAMVEEVKRRHAPNADLEPRSLAEHFIAVFEGSLILARSQGSVAPVQASLAHFKRYLRALFAPQPKAGRA